MPPITNARQHKLRRVAFTLIEVTVALVILLVLAAVALPSLVGYMDQMAAEDGADQLATVRDALYLPGGTAFRQDVGRNAGRLSQLSRPILAKSAGHLNSCGGTYAAGQEGGWNGPYINFDVDPASGMATAIGLAQDSLARNPPGGGTGTLRITFPNNVEQRKAQLLDEIVDGGNGNATGIVQWILPPVNGQVTVHYFVPIDNSC